MYIFFSFGYIDKLYYIISILIVVKHKIDIIFFFFEIKKMIENITTPN